MNLPLAQFWSTGMPQRASEGAERVDALLLGLLGVSAFFILLILILIVRFAIKYRAGSSADRANPVRKTWGWELTWIAIPSLLMVGMFVWAGILYLHMQEPPADARTIYVVGKQWMWKVQHPEGPEEINELHVPAGEPVKLVLSSQDVIHSFFRLCVNGRLAGTFYHALVHRDQARRLSVLLRRVLRDGALHDARPNGRHDPRRIRRLAGHRRP